VSCFKFALKNKIFYLSLNPLEHFYMADKNKTRLDLYDNKTFNPGKNIFILSLWYFVNVLFFINPLNPISRLKVAFLRLFGAKVGKGVNIKPSVNIKYPWRLKIGNYAWIGENVWIDNLADVEIGDHSCISQGALLLTGNHNYKLSTFDLITAKIVLEEGVWIGAKSIVAPGVKCMSHSVLSAGSLISSEMEAYGIYSGNPAKKIRTRNIE
jgi:putative colanic acid biosynthesis acetyltransferase WcaF